MDSKNPFLKDDLFSFKLHHFLKLAIRRTTSIIDNRHVKVKV